MSLFSVQPVIGTFKWNVTQQRLPFRKIINPSSPAPRYVKLVYLYEYLAPFPLDSNKRVNVQWKKHPHTDASEKQRGAGL